MSVLSEKLKQIKEAKAKLYIGVGYDDKHSVFYSNVPGVDADFHTKKFGGQLNSLRAITKFKEDPSVKTTYISIKGKKSTAAIKQFMAENPSMVSVLGTWMENKAGTYRDDTIDVYYK